METVSEIPKGARYIETNNPNANNFVYFKEPEVLEYYTVTGDKAIHPNRILKETFLQEK